MQWYDTKCSYGWISIILHWLSAIAIFCLWYTGDSTKSIKQASSDIFSLHLTFAVMFYFLVWLRIFWRWSNDHPQVFRQNLNVHWFVVSLHHIMLFIIVCMLISGPMIILFGQGSLTLIGEVNITFTLFPSPLLMSLARDLHGTFAFFLLIISLLHIAAAFKHMMFNDDDSFIRMLVPPLKDRTVNDKKG